MNRFVSLLSGVSVVVGLVFVTAYAEEKVSKTAGFGLPSSLDSFYPPKAQQPVHLLRMFALGSLFSGIASDLVENDLQGARDVFEKFKTQYVEISKIVPKWKKEYP